MLDVLLRVRLLDFSSKTITFVQSVKQESDEYHFQGLQYDSTWELNSNLLLAKQTYVTKFTLVFLRNLKNWLKNRLSEV